MNSTPPVLTITAADRQHDAVASALAQRLGIPLSTDTSPDRGSDFNLVVAPRAHDDYQLELHFPGTRLAPLYVDFLSDTLKYRQQFGGGRQQPIARALGLKKGINPVVADATAGLGRDAFILASLGCIVHMVERNAVIHALLEDGLRRLTAGMAAGNPLRKRLHLYCADSALWLKHCEQPIDIIYLDPMYPHRSKSALVKKEMRILRSLVGDDLDVPALLDIALTVARKRVVVKRPKTAPTISAIVPSHGIESRKTRYDVYLTSTAVPGVATSER
ncbi:MAG: class I SAM-dependent methyltransferase [Gammaproteobacteria bacterium]|jgi:16S rRNA (guanine1516-N2)-methyltransferase